MSKKEEMTGLLRVGKAPRKIASMNHMSRSEGSIQ